MFWRWWQSAANPSMAISPVTGKNSGYLLKIVLSLAIKSTEYAVWMTFFNISLKN